MILRRSSRRPNPHRPGFTLIETLLATSVFLLLVGAAIFSLEPSSRGSGLDQGAVHLESILRFARAEAAHTGRRVRVCFAQEGARMTNQLPQVRLTWEPEPLDEPDVFQDLSNTAWGIEGLNERVQVEQVRLMDSDNVPSGSENIDHPFPNEESVAAEATPSPPITFNPDGSSDSVEIILDARHPEDSRRITVRIIGMTGVISREITTDSNEEAGADDRGRAQEDGPLPAE